ncbi:MAG: hypothetical protein KatS3mg105_1243 [Gemmatales bacterium]|nr:MAG: hypothetical protein KatS3mg105_1243 [Gemmatales bacterium]
MTTADSKSCDVFISHRAADTQVATEVAEILETVGLKTFRSGAVEPGEDISDAIWQALAESRAFIAIVTPHAPPQTMGLVEVGAATAWNKPIFVVINGPSSTKVPAPFSGYPAYTLGRLDDVVQAIQRGIEPLTEDERRTLIEVYEQLNIPTDQLTHSYADLRNLAMKFNRRARQHFSGERLLSELFRLRKQGKLPRLKSPA